MSWVLRIEWHPAAVKEFARLDRAVQKRIRDLLTGDLHARLETYRGELKGFVKLRVGDFRLICRLRSDPETLTILLVGHRSNVYSARRKKAARTRDRAQDD